MQSVYGIASLDTPVHFKQLQYNQIRKKKKGRWPKLQKVYDMERANDGQAHPHEALSAGRSMLPHQRYCDFTGFVAPYTDPSTGNYSTCNFYSFIFALGLHFANVQAFRRLMAAREAGDNQVKRLLEIRGHVNELK